MEPVSEIVSNVPEKNTDPGLNSHPQSSTGSHPASLVILGIPFHDVTFAEAVDWCMQRIRSGRPGYVATVNLDFVMQSRRDPELQRILLEADLVVADGAPLIWMSGLFGPRLRERVTGSDLTPLLAEACRDNGFSIFGLGAAPGVAETALRELERRSPGLRLAGWHSPPKADILDMNHADILQRLRRAEPDLLLVAFGAPKQEKWINMHFRQWRIPLAVGIGGTLDFLAGVQRRAPKLVQKIGMEWFWRMLTDPRRLLGRYAANLLFLARESVRLKLLARPEKRLPRKGPSLSAEVLRHGQARLMSFHPLASSGQVESFLGEARALAAQYALVLDLARAPALNSLELGVLVDLDKSCRARQRRLVLWNVRPRMKRFLRACGLTDYLDVVSSREELEARLAGLNLLIREGTVLSLSEGTMNVRLPLELTVTNLDGFRDRIDREWAKLTASGRFREIDMDAAGVEFLDSAALGFLVGLKRQADQAGVALHCHGFQGAAMRTVKLARLEELLGK
jgi:N-acetylglucosaminyldiphosphoundecaprenol N-acetyl-beta-D-mannosaminyltransferase